MRTPAGKDRLSDIYAKICHAETWIILDELSHFSGMAQTQSSVSEILIKNNESFFLKEFYHHNKSCMLSVLMMLLQILERGN